MRICLLTTSTTVHQMGGTEVQAEMLAAEAARQGHAVFVLTAAHPSGLKTEFSNGYRTIYIEGTNYKMSRRTAPAWWRLSAAKTSEICAAENIDVVWAANFAGISYAAIPGAERRPVISIVQGLAVRGEILSTFNAVSSPAQALYFLTRYAAQTLFYYIPRFRAMVRDSDLLIGVSLETVEALKSEFPGSGKKAVAILNPVDTAVFRPDAALRTRVRSELGLPENCRVIIMSGVIHRQKGMHLGLNVFAKASRRFPDCRLLIVGDGPDRKELERAAAETGLAERVIFTGSKSNVDMPGYYNAADIYLNPTLRLEGLALVIVEAMACGLPCVVSKIGGTASSLEDGKSGFFTRPGNVAEMTEKTLRLLEDAALRAETGTKARTRALEVFSKELVTRRYVEVSEKLLKAGSL